MTEAVPTAPHVAVFQILAGRWLSHAVAVAAELQLADLLTVPQTAASVAEKAGLDANATHRLLRALASHGIFSEGEGGVFFNTPMSDVLRTDAPVSVRPFARFINHPATVRAWTELGFSLRHGAGAFERANGMKPWEFMASSPDAAQIFSEAMTATAAIQARTFADNYDFSAIDTLVDVGGGQGQLLSTIVAGNSKLHGVLFEIPPVAEQARNVLATFPGGDRCEIVAGDAMAGSIPAADAYVMTRFLHDWPDEHALQILKNVHAAAKPGAKLIVGEELIAPGNQPQEAKLVDLEMLVSTNGGRERTREEFASLFEAAGFRDFRVVPTDPRVTILEATA